MHVVGLTCGLAACIALAAVAAARSDARLDIALAVFGVGLVTMLGCSATYNLAHAPRWRRWLRRLDHAAIFVMIAGTYTPFAVFVLTGGWDLALLAFVWTLAVLGVLGKLFLAARFERWSLPAYLLLGWCVLVVMEPLLASLSLAGLLLLLIGGLPLHRRHRLLPLGAVAVPQRGLAWLRAGGSRLSFFSRAHGCCPGWIMGWVAARRC